eukprot:GFKZ01002445.1.p1 GENE.GFKZ01002445.1~~GFKZ01002445.1.p1  ORF type:complete len:266 (-),score=8.50 GFKZ01002445.1:406-1146(-)
MPTVYMATRLDKSSPKPRSPLSSRAPRLSQGFPTPHPTPQTPFPHPLIMSPNHAPIFLLFLLFLRPLPARSQNLAPSPSPTAPSSQSCPCQCTVTSPKFGDICAGYPPTCQTIRCTPRSNGFACCSDRQQPQVQPTPTPSRTPVPPPIPPNQVRPDILVIRNSGRIARTRLPRFSRRAADILVQCSSQLQGLLDEVASGNTASQRQIGEPVRTSRSSLIAFRRTVTSGDRMLIFAASHLTPHLRRG